MCKNLPIPKVGTPTESKVVEKLKRHYFERNKKTKFTYKNMPRLRFAIYVAKKMGKELGER